MHKIKKNIKKKIKGKKGKNKEDDLFDPEQLALYKEELDKKAAAEKAAAEAAGGDQDYSPTEEPSSSTGAGADHEEDEEWKKFKALTSGIDSVLNKASGDLDRIKSSSYFQRIPPKPTHIFPPSASLATPHRPQSIPHPTHHPDQPQKVKQDGHWVNVETKKDVFSDSDEDHEESHKGDKGKFQVNQEEEEEEEKKLESPEPIEVDDDLFDTTFVDKVATGDIKLAYIPDSPEEKVDEGDDPFDTSAVADVVKKIEEEEKRQKRKVNLGLAVNVLTGKGEEVTTTSGNSVNNNNRIKDNSTALGRGDSSKKKRRPRPHHINLLGSFDGSGVGPTQLSPADKDKQDNSPPTDLFDTILDAESSLDILGDVVVPFVKDSSSSAPNDSETRTKVVDGAPEDNSGLNLKELLSEFDVISDVGVDSGSHQGKESLNLAAALNENVDDDLEDEFAALAVESLHKDSGHTPTLRSLTSSPAPGRPPPPTKKVETPTSPDPFDTTYVQIDNEPREVTNVNDDDDDFDFNPREGEPEGESKLVEPPSSNLSVQKDLLGGSSTDLTALLTSVDPIHPVSEGLIETEIHDPFDTSVADTIVPGKAELKLLEEELLKLPHELKSELQQQVESIKNIVDKFNPPSVNDDDDDFDPRQGETVSVTPSHQPHTKGPQRPPPPVKVPEIHPLDLDVDNSSSGLNITDNKTLTPQIGEDEEEEEIDPFDTSSVPADVINPGKLELKLLESELVKENLTTNSTTKITSVDTDDFDFDPRKEEVTSKVEDIEDIFDSGESDFFHAQPLEPSTGQGFTQQQQTDNFNDTSLDDPFDTSYFVTDSLLPGKAELKFLEKELLNSTEDFQPPSLPKIAIVYKSTVVQPPNPEQVQKQLETQQSLHPLEIEDEDEDTHSFVPLQPLTPSQFEPTIDPFDTSIADSIVPGKAELKILEAELGFDPSQRRLSDPDFNPRGGRPPIHPSQNFIAAPLIPQTVLKPQASSIEQGDLSDPFDTSVADAIVPGKAELKILEAELL